MPTLVHKHKAMPQAKLSSYGRIVQRCTEDVFHSEVPYQLDISMCNQRVYISFTFRVCMCMTFL